MKYNKEYSKNEMIKRICESAKKYKDNLLNKNIMFIYINKKTNEITTIETMFEKRNFLHLTGMKYNSSAKEFFSACINMKLSPKNITIRDKVFTQLKLEILENAMSISKSAKRIGDYNNSKVNIAIEKIIGTTHYSLGFSNLDSKNKKLKYYYPKTLLQDNLKNNIINDNRIIAILSKNKNQNLYDEITYLSKETTLLRLKENEEINNLIDFKKVFSQNLKYQEKIHNYLENKI